MFKKLTLAFAATYLIQSYSFAQSFMHSAGVNISILHARINHPSEQYTFDMAVTHLSYFPRYTIVEQENSSISIGIPFGAGIGILRNVGYGDGGGIVWGVDLPLVVDYNIGWKSTPDNENGFGGYFGAGFGYMYTGWTGGGDNKANSYGPLGRAGVRFASRGENLTVGIFYKSGLEKDKYKTYGFNILYDF